MAGTGLACSWLLLGEEEAAVEEEAAMVPPAGSAEDSVWLGAAWGPLAGASLTCALGDCAGVGWGSGTGSWGVELWATWEQQSYVGYEIYLSTSGLNTVSMHNRLKDLLHNSFVNASRRTALRSILQVHGLI